MTQSSWHITLTIINIVLEVGQTVSSKKYWRAGGVAASGFGKAVGAQKLKGTWHTAAPPPSWHPRGGSAVLKGWRMGSPRDGQGCQLSLFLKAWTWSHRGSRKGNSSDQKVHTKGETGAEGKLAKMPKHRLLPYPVYLAIVNNAAMNTGVHVSFQINGFLFLHISPEAVLLDYRLALIFIFWESSILFSIVAAPIHISNRNVEEFPFLHTLLTSICYLWSFWWHPLW